MKNKQKQIDDIIQSNDLSEEDAKVLKSVVRTADKVNKILGEETVQVCISVLSSCLVQIICLTSNSKEEALNTIGAFHHYVKSGIVEADDKGICNWNGTLQ